MNLLPVTSLRTNKINTLASKAVQFIFYVDVVQVAPTIFGSRQPALFYRYCACILIDQNVCDICVCFVGCDRNFIIIGS